MKILADLTHPAHVHFFKHAIWEWQRQGHQVLITSRDKDLTLPLLGQYGFEHRALGSAGSGLGQLSWELVTRAVRLLKVARPFQPDVMVAVGGAWIAPVGRLLGVPAVVFYATEIAKLNNAYVYPLADAVCTPASYQGNAGQHHVRYQGNHELAYLHPRWLTPDSSVLQALGLSEEKPFIIVRTVAWTSHHDVGHRGFSDLPRLVCALEKYGRVLITSEGPLHPDLERNRIRVVPHLIHHVMAFARLYIGESATMASESAVLGVPAIFVSSTRRGFTDQQEEKYGLTFTFDDMATAQEKALAKAEELLALPDLKERWSVKRQALLRDCVDVTQWMVDFVGRYDTAERKQ
jgi:predicted glycosyltransferase